jgi:IS5 family transposase
MLRIHLQCRFNLSDPAAEEALYDMESMRRFVGIDLGNEPVPDETTICKFRHLLEAHDLGKRIFREVDAHLQSKGLRLAEGTIMDATIIAAPSSTKNKEKKRDPDMHQVKKGNQYYFGMKVHIGVDKDSKLVHSLATTAANVHDSRMVGDLLHGAKKGSLGRFGLHRQDGDDPGKGTRCRRQHQQKRVTEQETDRRRTVSQSYAVQNEGKGGACLLKSEAGLRIHQGALQGAQEEHEPCPRDLCPVQPVHGEKAFIGDG